MSTDQTIEMTICKECGTDTEIDGKVDRLSYGGNVIDSWICGRCHEMWNDTVVWYDKDGKVVGRGDEEAPRFDDEGEEVKDSHLFERSTDDKMEENYFAKRLPEIDAKFPDAPRFRELCVIIEDQDVHAPNEFENAVDELRALVENYRHNADAPDASWNTAGGVLEQLLK